MGPSPGRRVVVAGISGAGKTTMARQLGAVLGLAHVEVDALFHGPGWQPRPDFVPDVERLTAGSGWVVDSDGYSQVRDLVWDRADSLVWLDYPRPVVMVRLLRRSFARATYDRRLWNGNIEGFRDWLDPSHPIPWAWTTFHRRRAETAARLADPRWAGLTVVRLGSPRAARRWLAGLRSVRAR